MYLTQIPVSGKRPPTAIYDIGVPASSPARATMEHADWRHQFGEYFIGRRRAHDRQYCKAHHAFESVKGPYIS